MKKHLTKALKSCWTAFEVVSLFFVLIYLGIYLSGAQKLNVGGMKLSFDSLTSMSIFVVAWSGLARDQIDAYLSTRDAKLTELKRKQRRWSLRLALWAAWFSAYFSIYAYGQMYYAYLGDVGLFDLLIVLVYGIVGIAIAVSMPKTGEIKENEMKEDSLDSAML